MHFLVGFLTQLLGRLLQEGTDVLVIDAEIFFFFVILLLSSLLFTLHTEHVLIIFLLFFIIHVVMVVSDEILRFLEFPVESDFLLVLQILDSV